MPTPPVTLRLRGLVTAAGAATRFGSPKALALYRGEPLVGRAARLLLACCPGGVTVVTGAAHDQVEPVLATLGPEVRCVRNPDWAGGLSTSLRAGLAALPASAPAVLVMPCDLPAVGSADLARLVAAWQADPGRIAAATFPGGPGPPVILPRAVWPACAAQAGDRGARAVVIAAADRTEVPMPAAALDVDTPEDLATLAARAADAGVLE